MPRGSSGKFAAQTRSACCFRRLCLQKSGNASTTSLDTARHWLCFASTLSCRQTPGAAGPGSNADGRHLRLARMFHACPPESQDVIGVRCPQCGVVELVHFVPYGANLELDPELDLSSPEPQPEDTQP